MADLSGGPITRTARLRELRLPVRVESNEEWLVFEIERTTSLCFAEPVPERVIGCNRAIGAFAGMPIFVPGWYAQTDRITGWLQSRAHVLAPSLNIDGERFLVANNKSVFFLTPTGAENDIQRLEALLAVVEQLPAGRDPVSRLVLPDHLRGLGPLVNA